MVEVIILATVKPKVIDKARIHALHAALVARKPPDLILDYTEFFTIPFMDALHDDRAGLEAFLQEISIEELDDISEVWYAIYEKWHDKQMYDLLKSLEKKIEKYYKGLLGLK